MYNFNEKGHITVIGRTQSGKTYAVNKILKDMVVKSIVNKSGLKVYIIF